ncbi:hypothetical protein [Bdellovibrio sp. KM01]|uniref:hypothetical protein n=1 Tax=Bdellovibrio sp. KM01 TaxID=2748865 RepID=UPI0015EA374D|nr:hypothetical protein [Bdellovibrio sp. KM01]QLY24565.1 hypothetical protein HW988_14040 [Bdellovibrio sp. KM01]
MINRLRFLNLTTAVMLVWSSAFAQVPEELQEVVLTGNLFGRSSADFSKSANNIKTTVTQGTKGTVVESRRMKSPGSYGVKIRLTEVGKGKTNAKPGDEVWVYYNKKNPWITFRDTKDLEVQNPENALTAKARQSGEGIPAPASPTPADDKSVDPNEAMPSGDRSQTEAGTGNMCLLNNSCGTSANHDAMKSVADKILDDEVAKGRKAKDSEKAPDYGKEAADKKKAATLAKLKKRTYTMEKFDWSNFPEVMKYSESAKANAAIKAGIRNREPGSTGRCYAYVKDALLASGLVKSRPPGGHAKNGVKDLKAQGFINLMDPPYKGIIKSPDDAPKGSVIIYETSDKRQSGDIQIKTDWSTDGSYVSDFLGRRSDDSDGSFLSSPKAKDFKRRKKPYKIVGVMIKP